jgi:choline monooxygenase
MNEEQLAPQLLARSRALPASYYTGEASAALDRRAVFAQSWQLLGDATRLEGVGDHLVGEVAGVPLVLVRGEDGVLRALHNVCRHRAGPLATCDGRGARQLRCRYHGWTYTLDGRLRSAPDMGDAEDFDPASIRLGAARAEVWQGLAFAALDASAPPLAELVDGIEACLGARLAGYRFHRRVRYEIACNWKVYVDNFLEGYHVPHIHPELNRMLDYRSYVIETGCWNSLQYSPLESGDELYGRGEALYWYLWPNTMLNVLPDRLQTNRVVPLGAERCAVEFDYYYPAEAGEPAVRHQRDHAFSDLVQQQDMAICEHVQRGLASGTYTPGRLNPRHESGVYHFHELLRAAYRADSGQAEFRHQLDELWMPAQFAECRRDADKGD